MTEITAELLLSAYASGIFPMAESRDHAGLHWFDPARRGLLPLHGLHVAKRLRRTVLSARFEVRTDTAFREVMLACAEPAPGRESTWINGQILDLYCELHQLGFAHSVECWREGRLVGGLYGVSLGAAFFGESMFSRETDASKVALVHLVGRLNAGGYLLLDTQWVTHHLGRFGAFEVSRAQYRRRLHAAIRRPADFDALSPAAAPAEVLQWVDNAPTDDSAHMETPSLAEGRETSASYHPGKSDPEGERDD